MMKYKVKSALALFLLASPILSGMEKIEHSTEATQPVSQALRRFPGYYYFLGLHTEMEGSLESYLKKSLLECLDTIEVAYHKIELLNFCAALECAAAVFLTRPLEEWTLVDLQKINALLMHNLPADDILFGVETINYNLGKFKTDNCLVNKQAVTLQGIRAEDAPEKARKTQLLSKLMNSKTPRLVDLLTEDELSFYDQLFVRTSDQCDVVVHLQEYLETLKTLSTKEEALFELASYAHTRLSQIHRSSKVIQT
ncbi:hypothetical protein H0W26_02475 [Candidatus Dependentiae bacterium]|nr:hypothetical protein [Candidatus Dependentiae bacterium]